MKFKFQFNQRKFSFNWILSRRIKAKKEILQQTWKKSNFLTLLNQRISLLKKKLFSLKI